MSLRLTMTLCVCTASICTGLGLAQLAQAAEYNWPAYGGAPGGGHYTASTQITPTNVAQLGLAWHHRSGDFIAGTQDLSETGDSMEGRPSSFIVTPIMFNDTVYYCTPFNRVFALDPATGEEKWVFDAQVDMTNELLTNCRGVSSWADQTDASSADSKCSKRILLGTLDARLIALDADTGARCADFGQNGEVSLTQGLSPHEADEYSITSAPAIIGDTLITGSYVADSVRLDIPSGVVRAYDVRSGAFLWGWNPVHPERPQKNADGTYVAGTTNVWSTISVDEQLGLVFVPTGNSSPDYYGGDRQGELDYYSSSIVALNAADGSIAWHYQTVHHDIWDYDVPAQPTLVDLTIDGITSPALVQVTKMGMTFVLDRRNGKPLHPIEERAVPQTGAVPGEYLSPTQPFPLKPEPLHQLGISPDDAWGLTFWDKGECRKLLESIQTGPIYTPPSLTGTAFYPSNLGGNNWGAPAVDPERRIMVTNTKHFPTVIRLAERPDCPEGTVFPQHGSAYCTLMEPLISPWGLPCTAPPWATLAAVDLQSGNILWQRPLGTLEDLAPWPAYHFIGSSIEMGGPMVTATGLTFIAATSDAYLRAFSNNDGAELWRAKLPSSGNAVPMSYTYQGSQYVVIAAGGHFTSPQPSGDHVLAFKLGAED